MKKYANFDIAKLKLNKRQEIRKRNDHVNRGELTHACNVNPELSSQNKVLVGEENANWFHLFELRYNELEYYRDPKNKAIRKDAVIILEGVATMSHDAMDTIDIDAWAQAEVEWVQKKYGKNNVVHAVLHMDEAGAYHIHFAILPIIDGHFCAKEINGGPHNFQKLQDEHAEAMKPFGLRRGLRAGSRMEYMDVKHLYNETMEIEEVKDLPEMEQGESFEEYWERANELYRGVQLNRNALKIENNRLQKLREYAHELEVKVKALMEQIKKLRERRIGRLFIENILAGLEFYQNHEQPEGRKLAKDFVEAFEVNFTEWHEEGKRHMTEPLIDEPEIEDFWFDYIDCAGNSTEGDDDSTEDLENR